MMTLEEAETVGAVIAYADGGCQHCVTGLAHALTDSFPDYEWVVADDFYNTEMPVTVKRKA